MFSPEKGDPSVMTVAADIFDGSEPWESSVGAQEAGDDQQQLLPLPHPSSFGVAGQGLETNGGWGGGEE